MTSHQHAPAAPARPAGTRTSRVASVIIALACIVVAGIGVHVTDGIGGEAIRTVDVNQPVHLDNATVTVTGVRAGSSVVSGTDDRYTSKGMILAVTVRVEAPGEEYSLNGGLGGGGMSLHAGDRSYSVFGANTSVSAAAGFVSTGDLLFEVDPRHIDGAYVEFYRSEFIHVVPQTVHIRLGITSHNAPEWAASAKGRTISTGDPETEPLP